MKFYFTCLFAFAAALSVAAQETEKPDPLKMDYTLPDPTPFATGIRADELKVLLYALTSKEMQGRETGKEGQRRAAEYIAAQFKAIGLPPAADRNTYLQNYRLQRNSWKDIALIVKDKEFTHREDFFVFSAESRSIPKLNFKEVVFAGYGITEGKYNDYAKADVKGKAVMFYAGEPVGSDGKSLLTGGESRTNWSLDWRKKVQLAQEKGAAFAFIVDPNFAESLKSSRRSGAAMGWKPISNDEAALPDNTVNAMFVKPEVAAAILGKKFSKAENMLGDIRSGRSPKGLKIKTETEVRMEKEQLLMEGSNVIGWIEGSDPSVKNEYIFITAHYDHLGIKGDSTIYYGADDDGSGTSAVIEIARAFAEAKQKGVGPRRSVVCMLVSGEEKGLLGSKYYVDLPIFPLKQTVCDINIDMVGRVDERHNNNPNYVYVIGSDRLSMDLHYINERANKMYTKMELDYKYNDPNDPQRYYKRSDHYNFAEQDIPVVFYFNGTHADYHKPTDTPDKINYDMLAKRAQLAFYTAWDIANRPLRIYPDVKK